jgi:hypothetical protein
MQGLFGWGLIVVSLIAMAVTFIKAFFGMPSITGWIAVMVEYAIFVCGSFLVITFNAPAYVGLWWGYDWVMWATALFLLVLTAVLFFYAQAVNFDEGYNHVSHDFKALTIQVASLAGSVTIGLMVLLVIVGTAATWQNVWFDGPAHDRAKIANIHIASDSEPMPPTDVKHIVMVTKSMAEYIGKQKIASTGQNLGSLYHFGDFTLQSVQAHLYWIAPLSFNNINALSMHDTPGYVVVDAENPNGTSEMKLSFHLHYLLGSVGDLGDADIVRHAYTAGYTDALMLDPTFEVDDNWQPYWTITLAGYAQQISYEKPVGVLTVDAQTGEVKHFDIGQQPSWIDRVMPDTLISQYAKNWGYYNDPRAGFFNWQSQYNMKPADNGIELVYNNADRPVWVIPMTSNQGSDNSSTGVVLYDSNAMQGTFYPFSGYGIGDNVTNTFAKAPWNLKNYNVSSVQLYTLYGKPTWVAIYTTEQNGGESFQGIGLVAAADLNGTSVIASTSKDVALAQYSSWLASQGDGQGPVAQTQKTAVAGSIYRINCTAGLCSFIITGNSHVFTAQMPANASIVSSIPSYLPLVQPGDKVQLTYVDTNESTQAVTLFSDMTLLAAFK